MGKKSGVSELGFSITFVHITTTATKKNRGNFYNFVMRWNRMDSKAGPPILKLGTLPMRH